MNKKLILPILSVICFLSHQPDIPGGGQVWVSARNANLFLGSALRWPKFGVPVLRQASRGSYKKPDPLKCDVIGRRKEKARQRSAPISRTSHSPFRTTLAPPSRARCWLTSGSTPVPGTPEPSPPPPAAGPKQEVCENGVQRVSPSARFLGEGRRGGRAIVLVKGEESFGKHNGSFHSSQIIIDNNYTFNSTYLNEK